MGHNEGEGGSKKEVTALSNYIKKNWRNLLLVKHS